jgi:hypothetical protein
MTWHLCAQHIMGSGLLRLLMVSASATAQPMLLGVSGYNTHALVVLQATEIHKEFAARRSILQQQLARLQQESRLSVNPLLLPGGVLALPAAGQRQQQDGGAAGQQEQPQQQLALPGQQNAAAAAAGYVPAAGASLAVAGPHEVTPQGNIILLPDGSIQEKLDKLLAQVEEFTTPRWVLLACYAAAAAAAALMLCMLSVPV